MQVHIHLWPPDLKPARPNEVRLKGTEFPDSQCHYLGPTSSLHVTFSWGFTVKIKAYFIYVVNTWTLLEGNAVILILAFFFLTFCSLLSCSPVQAQRSRNTTTVSSDAWTAGYWEFRCHRTTCNSFNFFQVIFICFRVYFPF